MKTSSLGKEAIGRYATSQVPVAEPQNKVGTLHKQIFEGINQYASINYIYVVKELAKNRDRLKLVGVLSIKELADADDKELIKNVMKRQLATVRARTHRERAVYKALEHSLKAIPVIDKNGYFLGAVPSDSLLKILHEEANQDLFYIAGSDKAIVKDSIISQVKARVPWVLVGLSSGIVSTSVIAAYEGVILQLVKIAAFIPVMLSISGNVATQSAVLFVREIAFGRVRNVFKSMIHEWLIGVLIGVISGISLALIAIFLHDSPLVGAIVAISIVITQATAAVLGFVVPWLFSKLGKDPAMGSGSVVTTLMDIVATSVYLTVAWGLLQLLAI